MTICVCVRTPEAVVLAADSMVTLEGTINTPQGQQTGIVQTFEFANKVIQIKDYPVGVMSWGLASLGARSIQSIINEFEHGYSSMKDKANYTIKEIGDELLDGIRAKYNASFPPGTNQPVLGVYIGGYSAGQFFSDQFVYEFPKDTTWRLVRQNNPNGTPSFGVNWFGLYDALTRLINGFDTQGLDELIKRGVDKTIVQKWVEDHVSELPLVFDGMPIQDAVDFANYAVQVVIGRFRFGLGPPLCGGDIDIAVITPNSFQWAQHKRWSIKS